MGVRFGIIGAGQIAQLVSWVFRDDPRLQVRAVADIDNERAGRLAAQVGEPGEVDVYQAYEALLERKDIDAAYICTPPFLHKPMILAALAAGKHVLCEKPFVLNHGEALEVVHAAAQYPHLRVGCCSSRFHDAATARRARTMILAGEIGSVYRMTFEAVSGGHGIGAKLPPWRNDPTKNGGGIAYDWGVYDLDWISFLMGDRCRPRTLYATMGSYFPLTEDRVPPAPDVDGRFSAEIMCEEGLALRWERRAGEHGRPFQKVAVRGSAGGLDLTMTPAENGADRLVHSAYVGKQDLSSIVLPEEPPNWRQTLVYPIRDFAESILTRRDPASPPARTLFVHAVLDAIYKSAQLGASVSIAQEGASVDRTILGA